MTDNKFDIIFILMNSWNNFQENGFRTREAIILKRLAGNEWVNKIMVIDNTDPKMSLFLKFTGYLEQVGENVFLYRSIYLKILHYVVYPRWGQRAWSITIEDFFINRLRKASEKVGIKMPVLWMTNALRTNIIGRLNERLVVFDVIDNWLEHPQFTRHRAMVEKGYEEVIDKADIIFTVSKNMASSFGKERDNVYHIPNAVDISLYEKTMTRIPEDLKDISRPLIGYVGVLQERLDVSLLEYLSDNCPEMNFIFVGMLLSPKHFHSLKGRKNVFLFGDRHSSLIPDYIQSFDVCTIPHKINPFTESMDPLKLYEYMAAGKPVVSTSVPPTQNFEDIIYIARDKEEFLDKLKLAVTSKDDIEARALRRRKAMENSWDIRMEKIFHVIDSAMKRD